MPQLFWNQVSNPTPFIATQEEYGPFLPQTVDAGEFGLVKFVQSSVSKVVANADRLFQANKTIVDEPAVGPAWYNIPGRLAAAASGLNQAFQSTLLKVIVLVAIVGLIAIFGLSYVQAKGVQLGNTSS